MAAHEISEYGVPTAAEDKFLVFGFGSGRSLCPHADHANHLGEMVYRLRPPFDRLTPIFDLRGLEGYYNDIDTFIRSVGGDNSYVLLGDDEVESEWEDILRVQGLVPIRARGQSFPTEKLDLTYFDCEAAYYEDVGIHPTSDSPRYDALTAKYFPHLDAQYGAQLDDLCCFIESIYRNSLLVEFTMSVAQDSIQVTPYHSRAIHDIGTPHDHVLVGRPAVIAATTGAVFSKEIDEFQRLINDQGTRERHIQRFLEMHPSFLQGLNYQNVYPQLVLERDDDGPLKPDFILEPFDDAFCDILDIKLPTQALFVGRKDRATLAAGLHEVAAQLREYAAYFEQEKYRKLVRQKYGLQLYRPRLIAIVGRDMKQMSKPEFRRAITEYDNLQFMTFDELLLHAQRRILI